MSEYIIDFTDANYTVEPIEHNGEIVRCRNCKHYIDTPRRGSRCVYWMTLDCFENPIPSEVEPDGFCAWGELKDSVESTQHGLQ